MDRFGKVYNALSGEFPAGGDVTLAVGIGEVGGDALVAFQESEETLVTDNTRQTRTIGVRLVAVSGAATTSKEIMNRAVAALENAANIRVFDRTGAAVDLDPDGPLPEGVFLTSQRVDLR